ncbi:MAG: response regulator [Phycisphaerales bacterium]|jgi:DNA-binding response OmpR family regulator|nr:response regulator [Phycisphaerales bacterium]
MAKILIVDDDPDVVDATEMFLKKEGHETATASSRKEGMQKVQEFAPELLILDCMMEEVDDGMVMARELRSQGFTAPILMLSSIGKVLGQDFDRDDEILPVEEFIDKPVDPRILLEKVAAVLNKSN